MCYEHVRAASAFAFAFSFAFAVRQMKRSMVA